MAHMAGSGSAASILGVSLFLLVVLAEFSAAQFPSMPYQKSKKRRKPWDDGHDKENDLLVTKKVFLDFSIDDEPIGRVVIGLFGEAVPMTVQNFAGLARGSMKIEGVSVIFLKHVRCIIYCTFSLKDIYHGHFICVFYMCWGLTIHILSTIH